MSWYRIDDPPLLNLEEIKTELNNGKEVIIQFSHPRYRLNVLNKLDDICSNCDNKLHIRFYGHYGTTFDCNILKHIPHVKNLSIDCLDSASNISALSNLIHLEELSAGIYELLDTKILRFENLHSLKKLSLGSTKTKQLNLSYLENYNHLQHLVISGHTKQINKVGKLKQLESIWMNSVSKIPLNFLNEIEQLKSLSFLLGGRSDLAELSIESLEQLKIIRVRGFNRLDNLRNFPSLKHITIEDQIQLQSLNIPSSLQYLSSLKLINCKKLTILEGLQSLPAMRELLIYQTAIDFDSFINSTLPRCLTHFNFYTTKVQLDKEIKEQLQKLGYVVNAHP